jgi:ElaB/YqjD/DUF883 family membrane-anchored ribosome-binding protein
MNLPQNSKETLEELDKKARENPWMFITLAAVIAVFFGFLMGRKTGRKD